MGIFRVWEAGGYASKGLTEVAKWGSPRVLESELKASSRHIRTIIKARGLWYPNVNGKTFAIFRADSRLVDASWNIFNINYFSPDTTWSPWWACWVRLQTGLSESPPWKCVSPTVPGWTTRNSISIPGTQGWMAEFPMSLRTNRVHQMNQ